MANEVLGDSARLRGIVRNDQGVSVVISQPAIAGTEANAKQIAKVMVSYGFKSVPSIVIGASLHSSFYHPEMRIGIFDAAGDNFVVSSGMPIPVDVMMLRAGDLLHQQLMSLID